ncbi:MAG: hypothetical protein GX167_08275 [Firmicutes bacterium]|nr:hypothetical protein [Bacillota bacterium]
MKKFRILLAAVLLAAGAFFWYGFYSLRSYLVMFPISTYYRLTGLFRDIPLSVPGGKIGEEAFYPFALYFNAKESFARFMGGEEGLELSIIYYFGGFARRSKSAAYFNPGSETFSAFYGAYAVNNKSLFFTPDGKLLPEQIGKVARFDQQYLVMPAIGLSPSRVVFDYRIVSVTEDVFYAKQSGWHRVDAIIRTNSPVHRYRGWQPGYLQYGLPMAPGNGGEDYGPQEFFGRVYCRYFPEYEATIVLYLMAKDRQTAEQIDRTILAKARLGKVET